MNQQEGRIDRSRRRILRTGMTAGFSGLMPQGWRIRDWAHWSEWH